MDRRASAGTPGSACWSSNVTIRPGGFTHVFHRPGYEWDVGVHYLGEVNDPASGIRAVFDDLTDGTLQWQPMPDVYDRLVLGDRR